MKAGELQAALSQVDPERDVQIVVLFDGLPEPFDVMYACSDFDFILVENDYVALTADIQKAIAS